MSRCIWHVTRRPRWLSGQCRRRALPGHPWCRQHVEWSEAHREPEPVPEPEPAGPVKTPEQARCPHTHVAIDRRNFTKPDESYEAETCCLECGWREVTTCREPIMENAALQALVYEHTDLTVLRRAAGWRDADGHATDAQRYMQRLTKYCERLLDRRRGFL